MIEATLQELKVDGFEVSISKLCSWFGVARRSFYYKASRSAPTVNPAFSEPIKALIEDEPSFSYRTVANLLGFNKNTVQRIFQIKGWQVRKRPVGHRPGSKLCHLSQQPPTNAGPPISAASGAGGTAG